MIVNNVQMYIITIMWVCSAVRKRFTVILFALQLFYTMQLLPIRSAMPFLVVNLRFSAPLSLTLI